MSGLINRAHRYAIESCQKEVESLAMSIGYVTACNVGGATNNRIPGSHVIGTVGSDMVDFNTAPLPSAAGTYDLIVCEQVVEHLHNTTWFLMELHRIASPNATLILTTEGLTSGPNRLAMMLGMAPFSMQPCCGHYTGGIRSGIINQGILPPNHPCHSGVTGHVRVMSRSQVKFMLRVCGWELSRTRSWLLGHIMMYVAKKDGPLTI